MLRFGSEEEFQAWEQRRRARIKESSVEEHKPMSRKVETPKNRNRHELNGTERRWFERLQIQLYDGEIREVISQAIKFRLAHPRCWYLPDFAVLHNDGALELQEIKGPRIWDDALVKFKVAREQYSGFRWSMWQWKKREWIQLY